MVTSLKARFSTNLALTEHTGRLHAAAAAKSLQSCPTLCDPIDGSPPGSRLWDSPGKNTGVGCHFLLQCGKLPSGLGVYLNLALNLSHIVI